VVECTGLENRRGATHRGFESLPLRKMILAAQILVFLSGIWLIGIGILMFIKPKIAAEYLGKFASTNLINYTEITLRCIWGISLILVSELSKFPGFFYSFGIILLVTSLVLFFIPRQLHSKYAVWWSKRIKPPYMRIASVVSYSFGIFLIYAII
jgi:hypothetical protein